ALLVIIELNTRGPFEVDPSEPPDLYLDVSGDNIITPLDALLVIIELNSRTAVSEPLVAKDEPPAPAADTSLASDTDWRVEAALYWALAEDDEASDLSA